MTDLLAQGPLPTRERRGFSSHPIWLCGLLLALTLGLALTDLGRRLPAGEWLQGIANPVDGDMAQLILHYSWLPRLCMALLCGAVLALAGTLMQQVLRNPLASPTTLGVSSGAQLGLLVATLWAPWALDYGREWVALAGGGVAALLVFALAWRRGLAPLTLILAGLVVTLYLSALNVTLMLIQQQDLNAVFGQDDAEKRLHCGFGFRRAELQRPPSLTHALLARKPSDRGRKRRLDGIDLKWSFVAVEAVYGHDGVAYAVETGNVYSSARHRGETELAVAAGRVERVEFPDVDVGDRDVAVDHALGPLRLGRRVPVSLRQLNSLGVFAHDPHAVHPCCRSAHQHRLMGAHPVRVAAEKLLLVAFQALPVR